MRIAIDLMGGDNAPSEIVAGSMSAAAKYPEHQFILVGKQEVLDSINPLPVNCCLVAAATVMAMDESVESLRQKRDCSIWLATKLIKDNEADAVISAGSTAAQMASALLLLGRIKGIERPAIASELPSVDGKGRLFLDLGANSDCTPKQLLQFAVMGSVYARVLQGEANPRVALLSNGSEDCKGNELTVAAHKLMAQSDLNFIGNLEGRDLLTGDYNVMVTDGFSGNIALKSIEGTAMTMMSLLKRELTAGLKRKIGAALVMPGLRNLKGMLDYKEHGGAPLVGVRGVSIICHGSSNAKAIKNAVAVAVSCLEKDLIGKMTAEAEKIKE